MGSSGDAAMEGKMAGVVCGGTRDGLEEGGKRGSDCSTGGGFPLGGRGGACWIGAGT